jgi:hypothetical protein
MNAQSFVDHFLLRYTEIMHSDYNITSITCASLEGELLNNKLGQCNGRQIIVCNLCVCVRACVRVCLKQ